MTRAGGGRTLLLAVASVAVAFAAADTYVVVLALPDMMATAGLSIEQLQRAAPIVSGFLLGYVAVLPLVGRIADLRGRVPVLVGSLAVFALGSAVTAAAYDLPSMVVGRFAQGIGAGGLVPATLALVADLYAVGDRGVPLGLVSAVQELGAVLGPVYGALVLAVAPWQAIFVLNLVVGLLLMLLVRVAARRTADARAAAGVGVGVGSVADPPTRAGPARDPLSWIALVVLVVALGLLLVQPRPLTTDVTLGLAFVPFAGDSRWATPVGVVALLALLSLLALGLRRGAADGDARGVPLLPLRAWGATARSADATGAAWLAVALAGIVLAFASADPERQAVSTSELLWLLLTVLAAAGFARHLRTAPDPVVRPGVFRARPAWGALVVSWLVGVALIAALVDVPVFARVTVYPDSQLSAALVLLRLLVAIPVGAVLGGWLLRRLSPGVVTAAGMALTTVGFAAMSQWGLTTLENLTVPTVVLLVAGLGFGLALAPVNDALLGAVDAAHHGVAGAMVVVARMTGMLVGISVLTTLGLRLYYARLDSLATVADTCPTDVVCPAYTRMLREAGLVQLDAVFVGAAVSAGLAAVAALVLLRPVRAAEPARG